MKNAPTRCSLIAADSAGRYRILSSRVTRYQPSDPTRASISVSGTFGSEDSVRCTTSSPNPFIPAASCGLRLLSTKNLMPPADARNPLPPGFLSSLNSHQVWTDSRLSPSAMKRSWTLIVLTPRPAIEGAPYDTLGSSTTGRFPAREDAIGLASPSGDPKSICCASSRITGAITHCRPTSARGSRLPGPLCGSFLEAEKDRPAVREESLPREVIQCRRSLRASSSARRTLLK